MTSQANNDMSSVTSTTSPTTSRPTRSFGSVLSSFFQGHHQADEDGDDFVGSKTNPWIILVNIKHPTRTPGGFFVTLLENKKKHNWQRPAYHINKTYHISDMPLVKCTVPDAGDFPEFDGRCILVREPALDTWQRKHELFMEGSAAADMHCEATRDALSTTEQAYDSNEQNRWKFYLLVFPEKINNQHFTLSTDSTVETNENLVLINDTHELNDTGEVIIGTVAFWEMALAKGGKPLKQTPQPKKSRRQLIQERRQGNQAAFN